MASRNPAASVKPTELRFRKAKLRLRGEFLRAVERLAPHVLRELNECRLAPQKVVITQGGHRQRLARDVYEWPAYDEWAAKHGLTIKNPGDDWIRVVAWGREGIWLSRRKGDSREETVITAPGVATLARAYDSVWRSEKARREAAGERSGVRDRASNAIRRSAEALVRWQVLKQHWDEILQALAIPAIHLAKLREDVSAAAVMLSLERRRGRKGRPPTRK